MFKHFSYFLYKILKILDFIFEKLLKKSFFFWFIEFSNNESYKIIDIERKKIKFFVPNKLVNYRVNTFFTKEPETLEWIKNFNDDEEIIFWDIGANIGLYSIYASLIHKNIKVYSFEPSTSNLRILSRNISINNLENKILINQFPLSKSEKGFNLMMENEFMEGGALHSFGLKKNFEGNILNPKNNYMIYGFNIDYIVNNLNFEIPNYLKIDVDGLEHQILEGGINTLSHKNIKSILIEINENYDEQEKKIKSIMYDLNFSLLKKEQSKYIKLSKEFEKSFNYIYVK